MKRVAVFAHYDVHNTIQDYVVYYIKELQKVAEKIIFVSDSELSEAELSKIEPYIVHSIVQHHGEYDFGSYKLGYQWVKESGLLDNCEEFILANDSCYAPLFSFDEMFSKMSSKKVDFWGVTANPNGIEIINNKPIDNTQKHIQSYFVVFKQSVFNSEVFNNFINSVTSQDMKEKVVAYYEVGLTKLLTLHGFEYDVYCELSKKIIAPHIFAYKRLIIENKCPFVKRSLILFKVSNLVCPTFTKKLIQNHTQYDYNLIKADRRKNKIKLLVVKSYAKAVRRSILRIHFKKAQICFMGHWYSFSKKL